MHFIENGTSGSQNIIISQGSGASVTIPSDTKAVYLDGAGSGAIVVDAFASLSVVDLKVQDDLTVTGDVDVDGTLEADAMTLNGTAITTTATLSTGISNNNVPKFTSGVADDDFLRVNGTDIEGRSASEVLSDIGASVAAGSSSIVTTGALDSGSITSGFGTIDTGSSTITTTGAITGGSLVADNITIDGTEIDLSSGSLTIDCADDIVLDADGGTIVFKDAGTEIGFFALDNSGFFDMLSSVSDADIRIRGNDGGSTITALTLDMSDAGTAIFNHDVRVGDNNFLICGAGDDVAIQSDGTNGTIFAGNDLLTLDVAGDIILDADGGDITFKDAGTEIGHLSNSSSDFIISSAVNDKDLIFKGVDNNSVITALTLDMSEAESTFNNNVTAFSDARLKDNIETLKDGLDKVEQLRGVTYTRDDREEIGVIAQEVEKILPEIVLTADDEMGTKSVDYSRITAVLIEAVKDLSARVKELESK